MFKLASKPWQQEQSQISGLNIIFKMKGNQQIVGKINTNIFWSRSSRILKLVVKMSKKCKILLDLQFFTHIFFLAKCKKLI